MTGEGIALGRNEQEERGKNESKKWNRERKRKEGGKECTTSEQLFYVWLTSSPLRRRKM